MEASSAPPTLLPERNHLPCLQEIRSVKAKPFYWQSSVETIPFHGRVFLMLASRNKPSAMPAKSPQCQGQAFLLAVFCGDNSVSRACLSTAGVPDLTLFHARKKSAVSRTSLSTASLLRGQFRFRGGAFYCWRSASKTPLCSNFRAIWHWSVYLLTVPK